MEIMITHSKSGKTKYYNVLINDVIAAKTLSKKSATSLLGMFSTNVNVMVTKNKNNWLLNGIRIQSIKQYRSYLNVTSSERNQFQSVNRNSDSVHEVRVELLAPDADVPGYYGNEIGTQTLVCSTPRPVGLQGDESLGSRIDAFADWVNDPTVDAITRGFRAICGEQLELAIEMHEIEFGQQNIREGQQNIRAGQQNIRAGQQNIRAGQTKIARDQQSIARDQQRIRLECDELTKQFQRITRDCDELRVRLGIDKK